MSINKVNIETFEVLLEGYLNQLDNFSFKSNNELGQFTQMISSSINPMINEDGTVISDITSLYENDNYKELFHDIDNITNLMTSKMTEIKSIIYNKIHNDVEMLYDKIQNTKKTILEVEGIEDFLENKPNLNEHFEILKWTTPYILGMDKHSVVDYVHNLIKTNSNKATYGYILSAADRLETEFEPVNISNDDYEDVVEDITQEVCVNEGCDCLQNTKNIIDTIFKKTANRHFQRTMVNMMKSKDICKSSIYLNNIITPYTKVIRALKQRDLDLIDESSVNLYKNMSNIENYLICSMYYTLVTRELYLHNKLLLSDTVLNGDTYDEYTSNGLALEDVYKFKKMNYDNTSIPYQGITVAHMVSQVDMVNNKYNKWRNSQLSNVKNISLNAMSKAYSRVTKEYINKFDISNLPKGHSLNFFIDKRNQDIQKALRSISFDNSNITDHLYDFVVTCNYDNTWVPELLKMFREELVKMADTHENLEQEHIDLALCTTMAEYMANTLVEQFS